MTLPTSVYTLFGVLVCVMEFCRAIKAIRHQGVDRCGVKWHGPSLSRWLYVAAASAVLNGRLVFVFFLKFRTRLVWESRRLEQSMYQLLETRTLDPGPICRKIFLYDFEVCFHSLAMIASLIWIQMGGVFTENPACTLDGLTYQIYWLGNAFAIGSLLHLISWVGGPCMWGERAGQAASSSTSSSSASGKCGHKAPQQQKASGFAPPTQLEMPAAARMPSACIIGGDPWAGQLTSMPASSTVSTASAVGSVWAGVSSLA